MYSLHDKVSLTCMCQTHCHQHHLTVVCIVMDLLYYIAKPVQNTQCPLPIKQLLIPFQKIDDEVL
ncbi:hypothetical protein CROQUDRAFT_662875 [Cronartium quercuum f. sp. fusiforme G11]|uniref:Uncharacterized protein n=1 Tax=Cronartium quercuum f. sp. fusiforme G11 TaxID=708437 RepID=A0A9P6NDG7_9BASI|nr:hypothetical protein CROQUDRAFT_662875 [Cronartium quercuum f. sp. fusiforme G11]